MAGAILLPCTVFRRIHRFVKEPEIRSYSYKHLHWIIHWRFRPDRRVLVRSPLGSKMRLAPSSVCKVLFRQPFSDEFIASLFLDFLRPGMTAVDCGAHIGEYTCLFATAVGPGGAVHAFEPDPRIFPYLSENVTMNALENVRVNRLALADGKGVEDFEMLEDATCSSLKRFGAEHPTLRKVLVDTVEIRTTSLDDYVEETRLERIDAIKIDVEGAELALVQGSKGILKRFRPRLVFIECDGRENQAPLEKLLADLGYKIQIRTEGTLFPHIVARL